MMYQSTASDGCDTSIKAEQNAPEYDFPSRFRSVGRNYRLLNSFSKVILPYRLKKVWTSWIKQRTCAEMMTTDMTWRVWRFLWGISEERRKK